MGGVGRRPGGVDVRMHVVMPVVDVRVMMERVAPLDRAEEVHTQADQHDRDA